MSAEDNPPPSYQQATGLDPTSGPRPGVNRHVSRNGIPPAVRRSMEDENRPVPEGWVRQLDPSSSHHFYVDTRASPPRSIWHHPYDDETYLESLSPKERERVMHLGDKGPTKADLEAESTDEEDGPPKDYHKASHYANADGNASASASSSAAAGRKPKKTGFSSKMKDKLTGTTHEERERTRRKRAEEEARAYERHQIIRQAMMQATQTGQPQLVGRDSEGHDVYIEPPGGPGNTNYGYPGHGQYPGRPNGNPYVKHPAYSDPNARFIRPDYAYQRPYGYGYGGGMGMPLMAPMMLGGLGGGLLLGGLLGGF